MAIERLRVTSSSIETNVNFHVKFISHGKQDSSTNACHTRAIVTVLQEFLYKPMALHLVYTIAMLACEKLLR